MIFFFRILLMLLIVQTPYLLEGKEIRIARFLDRVDFNKLNLLTNLSDVEIIDCRTRAITFLGDFHQATIPLPNYIQASLIISFNDAYGTIHRYWLPSFRHHSLIAINEEANAACVTYADYTNCDALSDLGEYQFGADCNYYNLILTDYCLNSPVIIHPGNITRWEYIDYQDYVNAVVFETSAYTADFCNDELVFIVTEQPAEVKEEESFLAELNLDHLLGKKGRFTIKFGINCSGEIVNTQVVKGTVSENDILNIFHKNLLFHPAQHREQTVDSYLRMSFKVRNDWIKIDR